MPYQDFHRLYLDQSIWDTGEKHLRPSVRGQIMEQVQKRFPTAKGVWVVGALTTNYWDEDSDLDLLVAVPKEATPELSEQLHTINGRELITRYSPIPDEVDQKTPIKKNHPVFWYLVNDSVPPEIVAEKFGRIYNLFTHTWLGSLLPGKAQMTNPKALLQHINWRLFKYKETTELFPLTWTVAFAGFSEMEDREKLQLIDDLKWRRSKLDRLLQAKLRNQPKEAWKALEDFEVELAETEDENLAPALLSEGSLPKDLLLLSLHKWRYGDIAERLEEKAIKEAEQAFKDELMKGVPISAMVKRGAEEETGVAEQLLKRLNILFTLIVTSAGGHGNAVDVITRLFKFLLDTNRFVRTNAVRRKIVMALYRTYVQGR